jgi:carboxypeptidase Taq
MAKSDRKSPFVPPQDPDAAGGPPKAGGGPSFDFLNEAAPSADATSGGEAFSFDDFNLDEPAAATPAAEGPAAADPFAADPPAADPTAAESVAADSAPPASAAFEEFDLSFFDDAAQEATPPAAAADAPVETGAEAPQDFSFADFDEAPPVAPTAGTEEPASAVAEDFAFDFASDPVAEDLPPSASADAEAPAESLGFFDFDEAAAPSAETPSAEAPATEPSAEMASPFDFAGDIGPAPESSFGSEEISASAAPVDESSPTEISSAASGDAWMPDFGDATQAVAATVAGGALFGDELFGDTPGEPAAEVPAEPAAAAPPVEEPLPPDPIIEDTQPTPLPLPEDHPQVQTYRQLCGHMREASLLGGIEEALGWDERCMMPAAGAEHRAAQITLLSGIIHDRLTDPRIGEWLNELADSELAKDPHDDYGATLLHLRRQYEKRTKLPKSLVEELAHTAALGQHAWQEARTNDDFAAFAPHLTKMVDLKRQQADALGFTETRYDALLDDFEPGELTSRVTQVLGALRDELVPLVAQIRDGGRSPDLSVLERSYPVEAQRTFGRWAASQLGFDFERGRLDVTAHPFCAGLGPNDCRITTRYDEHFFNTGFFGILHEAGHGIYDQGLRSADYGLPPGEAVSMGIHESQSRLWEIFVGRSLPFWRHMYGHARRAFPAALNDVSLGRFYFAVNDVRPSLIRVEADEYTYNLHILIRFELEQALISGDLSVADLPGAWREKYRQYLGIECPNDADGVLQDIHWSAGLFGYFPTYSLGNLYAAQFFEQADQDLGQLPRRIGNGDFTLLRRWLNAKIHQQGRRYTAAELCERITGRGLSHEPLIRHLRSKYELLYAPEAAPIETLDIPRERDDANVLASEPAGDVGVMEPETVGEYGFAPQADAVADFGSMGVGAMGGAAATSASAAYKAKKKGGLLTLIILGGGIVLGGLLGTAMAVWILLWWKGPKGDVLKIRDKLPAWMVPEYVDPDAVPEPEKALPPAAPAEPGASSLENTSQHLPRVSDRLTQLMLRAARARSGLAASFAGRENFGPHASSRAV